MPAAPLMAHHRLMRHLVSTSFSSEKVDPRPEDLDCVARVFQRAGGSWVRVFRGSMRDLDLLKRTLKVAAKGGYLTRSPDWGG